MKMLSNKKYKELTNTINYYKMIADEKEDIIIRMNKELQKDDEIFESIASELLDIENMVKTNISKQTIRGRINRIIRKMGMKSKK